MIRKGYRPAAGRSTLFELYQFDRKVLLQLKAINALKRRESAQALYTFIESLHGIRPPISLARLRARLNLKSLCSHRTRR
ncbi:putative RepFIB replication protein A [Escherichia coli]|uniref:Putative RepFIB replication protein A n=1 Tax=Escherichia coli TaxID=562 RepID=A0A377HHP6_ECOLX|nr:putative RepFIB replication protein A [Escherichia coli]